MTNPENVKVVFGRRRSILNDPEDFQNAPILAAALAANYAKHDRSVLVLVNRLLQPNMAAAMRAALPRKPFFTSWSTWIGTKLSEDRDLLHMFASRVFVSPLEPSEFSNKYWDLTGRFLPDLRDGSFPAFGGYARLGIMAVKMRGAVFYEMAKFLETPDPNAEDFFKRLRGVQ